MSGLIKQRLQLLRLRERRKTGEDLTEKVTKSTAESFLRSY
jgi:hypothetical protein